MEGGPGPLQILRIIALLTFPISRLTCWIILRVKTKNRKEYSGRAPKDIILMVLRILFVAAAITTAILSFAIADQMLWTQIIADQTGTIVMLAIGFAIIVLADILILMSAVKLAKSAKNKEMTVMVTKGPYRLMRHPMHAAFFIFIIGAFIVRLNWFFDVLMLVSWAIGLLELPKEEESLVSWYGEAYIQYKKKTGALLPCPILDCGVSKENAEWIAENRVDTQIGLLPSMTEPEDN